MRSLLFALIGVFALSLSVSALTPPPATLTLPPLNSIVYIAPALNPLAISFRHCDYFGSFMPVEASNLDFRFRIVAALNGAPLPAVSFQSTNFATQYLTFKPLGDPLGERAGISVVAPADVDTASWTIAATGQPDGSVTLQTLSKAPALKDKLLTLGAANHGPCNVRAPSGDAIFAVRGDAARQALLLGAMPTPPPTPSPQPAPSSVPVALTVDARAVDHVIRKELRGCHFDPGFATSPAAWSSNMIYGQAFVRGPSSIYAWVDVSSAEGSAALDNSTVMNPLVPIQPAATLALTKTGGTGIVGWSNRGEGAEGLVFEAARDYEGYVMALAPAGGDLVVSIADRNSNTTLATQTLSVAASPAWQRVDFSGLVPSAATACVGIAFGSDPTIDCGRVPSDGMNPGIICVRCGGEFVVGLASVGVVHIGFVTVQPGAWGRLGDLPVLKSGTDMLTQMGFGAIRQGGSVSQSFRWKDWRGQPHARAAMSHVWGPTLVAPWGPFEFLDMANALDITPILTLAWDLNTPQDWGDLMDYLYADDTTEWGRVRIHNDSHPAPYRIDTFELGNEQENPSFVAQLQEIEARRNKIGPTAPEVFFMYPTDYGPNATVMEKIISSGIRGDRVMADCHVGASGGLACAERTTAWQDFNSSGICCETNARTSNLVRGVQEAADLMTWLNANASVNSRLRARTASFCVQRAGQLRDPWDQGLSFFLPNATWLQPPGVVHALMSQTWLANALVVTPSTSDQFAGAAQISDDRSHVNVMLTNADWGLSSNTISITLVGFTPAPSADLWIVAEPGTGPVNSTTGNTPSQPEYIKAVRTPFVVPASGPIVVTLPPLSFAILVLASA